MELLSREAEQNAEMLIAFVAPLGTILTAFQQRHALRNTDWDHTHGLTATKPSTGDAGKLLTKKRDGERRWERPMLVPLLEEDFAPANGSSHHVPATGRLAAPARGEFSQSPERDGEFTRVRGANGDVARFQS
ncbi:Protein of unknown function [Gryllus bimaculatus]|nr:Protein of unknown function [Gryllus bimaculatus]